MIGFLKRLLSDAASVIAKIRCPGCRALLQSWRFCDDCRSKLRALEGPICLKCGAVMPPGVSFDRDECSWCEKARFRFDSMRSAYAHEGPMRDAILQFKFRKKTALAGMLYSQMVERMNARDDMFGHFAGMDVVVPVPVHWRRLMWRGFNQSDMLAAGVAGSLNAPVARALRRNRYNRPQTGLSYKDRRENVKGAFSCARGVDVRGKNVLLIDDVATTGSTVSECAGTLKKSGAKQVHVFTLARKL